MSNKCTWPHPCNKDKLPGQLYCTDHCRALGIRPEKLSKGPQPIKKKSENKKQIDRELKKMYPVFLAEKRFICEIQSPDCTGTATVVHHMKGRVGEQVFIIEDWMACCSRCNGYVEEHDAWAREKGFKLNQHSNN